MYRPDLIFEVTSMTAANSYALRPCPESTELILGVYGRALELYPSVRLHALNPLSNHITSLISGSNPRELPAFIGYVKTNISKEIGDLHDLPYSVFGGKRAKPLPVSPDRESQERRLRYVLSQGTKEDLVDSPRDWPGVTAVHALERGEPLRGVWFDRTAEGRARRRKKSFDKYEYATWYEVPVSPLPCWAELPEKTWRSLVSEMVDDIERTHRARRRAENKTVLGADAVMAMSPRYIPEKVEKSPSPMVLAASKRAYVALRGFFDAFCELFWQQSRRSREEHDAAVEFPPFSFPPRRPMTSGPALPLELELGSALELVLNPAPS